MSADPADDIPVLNCWHCRVDGCPHCSGTGKLFWAHGYSFPYTPEGEARALKWCERNELRDK